MKSLFRIAAVTLLASTAMTAGAHAEFANRTIRLSSGVYETHPVAKGIEKMNACLGERSGGNMTIQTFFGGALGGDLQATQSLRTGTLDMVVTSTSPLVGIAPSLGVFDLPYLFKDEAEADAILDGEVGQYISDQLPGVGLVNLGYWENGFRNLANSRRPVATMDDISGLKIRVMQNNIYLDTFTALGANAVPMAGGEVFAALETRAIDGHENPVVNIETSKLYEVQKYLSMTAHTYSPFLVLYSKQLFDQLADDEQQALRDCAIEAGLEERAASRAAAGEAIEKLKEEGMEVTVPEAAELDKMREAVKPVYEGHAAEIGQDVIDRLQAELAKIRGQ